MKILIITSNLPPYLDANSAISYRIVQELHQTHKQEIVVLGLRAAPEKETLLSADYQIRSIDGQYQYTGLVPAHFSKIHKLIRVLSHPVIWPMFLRYNFLRHPLCGLYKKRIRQILEEIPDIDCIIAVSEPVDIPCAVTKLHPNIPWVSYRLDPWATHYLRSDSKTKTEEGAANPSCSAIFVQPAVYQEYLSGTAALPPDKVHAAEFPNLYPLPKPEEPAVHWERDKIHCAYVGQLYPDIRDPAFMLDLFSAMREAGIVLHIIGNRTVEAQYWQDKISDNIVLHGRVSYEKAVMHMQAADILVNLGNLVSNQMPSKVIDYLSTGKPILNIYKVRQCPTLLYMEKHPAALSIYEGTGLDTDCIHQVSDFCRSHQGYVVPYGEMETIYKECTPAYVGRQVYDVLCNICSKTSGGLEE